MNARQDAYDQAVERLRDAVIESMPVSWREELRCYWDPRPALDAALDSRCTTCDATGIVFTKVLALIGAEQVKANESPVQAMNGDALWWAMFTRPQDDPPAVFVLPASGGDHPKEKDA